MGNRCGREIGNSGRLCMNDGFFASGCNRRKKPAAVGEHRCSLRSQPGSGARVAPQQSPILLPGSQHFIADELVIRETADFVVGVVEGDLMIALFNADELSNEAASGKDPESAPADIAGSVDFAKGGVAGIFDGRQLLRSRSGTGSEAGQGRNVADCFMRTESVVDLAPPSVEILLEVGEVIASDVWPDFALQGAMQAFHFALSLRVIGTSVQWTDAKSDEPCFEPAERAGNLKSRTERVVASIAR